MSVSKSPFRTLFTLLKKGGSFYPPPMFLQSTGSGLPMIQENDKQGQQLNNAK